MADHPLMRDLKHELKRLRGGRALADHRRVLRLGPGFWQCVAPDRDRRSTPDEELIRFALGRVKIAIDNVPGDLHQHAVVEFGFDRRIVEPTLSRRQERLGEELGISMKTVRRRGDAAVDAIAWRLFDETRQRQDAGASAVGAADVDGDEILRRFWGIEELQHVDIVCADLPESEQSHYAQPRNKNYMRYAKFADLDSLMYLRVRLAESFPRCYIRDFTSAEYSTPGADHLFVIGGPDVNGRAEYYQENLPLRLGWDKGREEGYLNLGGANIFAKWTASGVLVHVYGMIAQLHYRQGLRVVLLAGCGSFGVLGAPLFLGSSSGPRKRCLSPVADCLADFCGGRSRARLWWKGGIPIAVRRLRSALRHGF